MPIDLPTPVVAPRAHHGIWRLYECSTVGEKSRWTPTSITATKPNEHYDRKPLRKYEWRPEHVQ